MLNSKLEETLYKWRVKSGLIVIIPVIILSKPNVYSIVGGISLTIIGLLIRTWACGHIQKEKELTISGPYRYTRNPLYLGNLIIGISIVVGSLSWWVFAIFTAYFFLFYPIVINTEKNRMNKYFPSEYEEFRKNVPLFFPSLKPYQSVNPNKFNWTLYRKNREIRALAGFFFFWLVIVLKTLFF